MVWELLLLTTSKSFGNRIKLKNLPSLITYVNLRYEELFYSFPVNAQIILVFGYWMSEVTTLVTAEFYEILKSLPLVSSDSFVEVTYRFHWFWVSSIYWTHYMNWTLILDPQNGTLSKEILSKEVIGLPSLFGNNGPTFIFLFLTCSYINFFFDVNKIWDKIEVSWFNLFQ